MKDKRCVVHDDLLKICFLARPAFSPDGSKIAYVASRADLEKNGYDSRIRVYDIKSGRDAQMTSTGSEKFFAWDGDALVFASKRGGGEKRVTRFYSMPADGGEAEFIFGVPFDVSEVRPLGGGRYLLAAEYKKEHANLDGADYYVFDEIPIVSNGKGFTGGDRTGVALYDRATGELRRLTPDDMAVERFRVSPDGTRVLVVGRAYSDVRPMFNHVYEIDMATGRVDCLSDGIKFCFNSADYFNGGVLTVGGDLEKGSSQNVKFYMLEDRALRCLTPALDSSLHNATCSDCRYDLADENGTFTVDGTRVVYCSTDGYVSRLHALNPDGSTETLTHGLDTVDNYAAERGLAVVGTRGLSLQELYLIKDGAEVRLTHHNDALSDELELSQPTHIDVDNGEGLRLDGWYMRPVGFVEGKKYPTILHIHGGPKFTFCGCYFHEMQCWAARGYAVIYANPRGGDGRTGGFEDIRGRYGVDDYNDIMKFTEHCVKALPFIDADRLGVTGGSYGGYMTNWIVTHTAMFKAAVSQRSISNWVSKLGSSDIGYFYVEDQHFGSPWEHMERPWNDSPLKYAKFAAEARTPLLLIHSNDDFRCERDQAFQMFTAMKKMGVECRLCLFNDENHELSRSGKPRNRLARLREITNWFDAHLGGEYS